MTYEQFDVVVVPFPLTLFTLDHKLVLNAIGRLGDDDQDAVKAALRDLLNLSHGR